mmetsp:Transcript_7337/g.11589  ORF Transcript_7337/g.11589 Transcript_7337/m.11589 type:complete len:241 (-) Transcript_7337:5869-6591(-)
MGRDGPPHLPVVPKRGRPRRSRRPLHPGAQQELRAQVHRARPSRKPQAADVAGREIGDVPGPRLARHVLRGGNGHPPQARGLPAPQLGGAEQARPHLRRHHRQPAQDAGHPAPPQKRPSHHDHGGDGLRQELARAAALRHSAPPPAHAQHPRRDGGGGRGQVDAEGDHRGELHDEGGAHRRLPGRSQYLQLHGPVQGNRLRRLDAGRVSSGKSQGYLRVQPVPTQEQGRCRARGHARPRL